MILRNLAGFTALSAIQHSTAHTHTPSFLERGALPWNRGVALRICFTIINLDIWQVRLISGAVGRETDSLPNQKNSECCYLGEAKTEWVGRAGDRRFKCDFKMHL